MFLYWKNKLKKILLNIFSKIEKMCNLKILTNYKNVREKFIFVFKKNKYLLLLSFYMIIIIHYKRLNNYDIY